MRTTVPFDARPAGIMAGAAIVLVMFGCGSPAETPTPEEPAVPLVEPAGPPHADVQAVLDEVLGSARHPRLTWPQLDDVAADLGSLYADESDGLFWFAGERPYPIVGSALDALSSAHDHGLRPEDYDADYLAGEWKRLQDGEALVSGDLAHLDLGLSVAALRLASAVHLGRVDPRSMDWGYDLEPKRVDLAQSLRDARAGGDLASAIEALQPPFSHYRRAQRALPRYAARAAAEPPQVPGLPTGRRKLEPGDTWEGVVPLRARLEAVGDLPKSAAPADPSLYDDALLAAVKSFQSRHGLEPDGVLGPNTLEALNVPLAERARQIELALERMRWLPRMEGRNIFVNVPLFRLWATNPESGEEPLRMNVVVGKSVDHGTPLFLETMEYVVFRPYWNAPYSIARSELVPKERREPGYLDQHEFEIVAGGGDAARPLPATPENLDAVLAGRARIRQKPGPHNALGLAKFIFPNSESIYMHGTPSQGLFARARRDFSHGCIRLENPAALAEWLLGDDPAWDLPRIEEAMNADAPLHVDLPEPVQVVLFYDTVHINSEGVEFFVGDIYGHDARLDEALRGGYPYPRTSDEDVS